MSDIMSQTIVKLFDTERFYAELIARMQRLPNKNIPVAGVRIGQNIELHINHDTFDQMTLTERVGILKHECEHILRDHIPRMKEIAPEIYNKSKDIADKIIGSAKHRVMNISADCAINYGIEGLPEGACYPELFDLPGGETFEWYLEHMKNNDKAKNFMEFDGHELWGESDDSNEIMRERIKQAVNEAAAKTRAAGRMTSDQELLVSKLNANTVDWGAQLRRFVAKTIESTTDTSKKKRNRRYGITFPGQIKVEELHLGVAIDTSGSVSDAALQQFMAEINKIAQYAKVTVVEADTEIKNSYVFKKKDKYKLSGRGGTAYKPAFDFFNDAEPVDALIYFGDMDCADESDLLKPKYPVLWAIVGNQEPPVKFGGKVYVKLNEGEN